MADKQTRLSIVIRTVDNATARIKAISERIDKATKPARDFKEALGDLRSKSGLDDVRDGFGGVGDAIGGILSKVAMLSGLIAGAALGLKSLIDGYDDLGDAAERAGVGVEFLAQTRWAAQKAGTGVENLDRGLVNISKSMGEMRAGGGPLVTFFKTVSPALLKQLKATKSNEEAFGLLADAMAKIQDPAKRAVFAQKALGDASLAPLLAKGASGIQQLRDRYAELAGPQAGAAEAAGEFGDSMDDLKAATDGIKAALVEGLAPALKVLVDRLREFFQENRTRIKEWAADLGKKLPGAVMKLVGIFEGVVDAVRPFVDSATKLKLIAVALAGVIVGPLVASIYTLGTALLTTPVGWIVGGIAAIAAGAYLLIDNWDAVAGFFSDLWGGIKSVFAAALDYLVESFLNFTPLGLIIKHWGPIADFFTGLWDGITAVFAKAWDFIKGIVDKVVGAVDWVVDKVGAIGDAIGGSNLADVVDRARAQVQGNVAGQAIGALGAARGSATEAKVTVDFANAPRGTRVQADPQSTADVDLSVGYQMGAL